MAATSEDKERVAKITKENVRGWEDANIAQIEVEEVSGMGGSKTFRVGIREGDIVPKAIAFHSRDASNKQVLEERNVAAGRAFANAGIGPALLAENEEECWCINEWGGEAVNQKWTGPGCKNEVKCCTAIEESKIFGENPADFREAVGQLLGGIHSGVPTDWAEPFRAEMPFLIGDKLPCLGFLGQKILQNPTLDFMKEDMEKFSPGMFDKWVLANELLTLSDALAQRVVTLHGDFHLANVLVHKKEGVAPRLCAIDFEFTNVGPAVFDLGYAFIANKALLNNAANKRAFVKGYVEAVTAGFSDAGASKENLIENLLVECEMASVRVWPPSEFVGVPNSVDLDGYGALAKQLSEFCSRARLPDDSDAAALREELLEKGGYAKMVGSLQEESS